MQLPARHAFLNQNVTLKGCDRSTVLENNKRQEMKINMKIFYFAVVGKFLDGTEEMISRTQKILIN